MSTAAAPQPVLLQVLFGLSFVVFWFYGQKIQNIRVLVWAWTGVQIALGVALVRGRLRAKRRVYRCVRCDAILR